MKGTITLALTRFLKWYAAQAANQVSYHSSYEAEVPNALKKDHMDNSSNK